MKKLLMGAAAAALFAPTAYAADLGGDCCADLEERVAELEATTARKGNRKVSLEVSGHVNQAVLFWNGFGDLGDEIDDSKIINNTNSESRFRFRGSAQINQEWSAGFLMEMGTGDVTNGGSPSVRHQALYLKSKSVGTVWLGKTGSATDGIMELSLASHDASTTGTLAPFDAFIEDQTGLGLNNPFDGGRTNVVKYISPSLAGFSLSAAWMEEDNFDIALRFANEVGQFRIVAGAGYRKEDVSADVVLGPTGGDRTFWGGSASVQHLPTGLFVDGLYGRSDGLQTISLDLDQYVPLISLKPISIGVDTELTTYGGRAGFAKKLFAVGKTTLYGEYTVLEIDGTSMEPKVYGLGIVQDIDAAAMSIYASYRHYDLDMGTDDTADVFLVGSKIRF